jgi:hypothetical protein
MRQVPAAVASKPASRTPIVRNYGPWLHDWRFVHDHDRGQCAVVTHDRELRRAQSDGWISHDRDHLDCGRQRRRPSVTSMVTGSSLAPSAVLADSS